LEFDRYLQELLCDLHLPIFMKNILILCYSNTGNSRFVADQLAAHTGGRVIHVVPRFKSVPILSLFSMLGWGVSSNISREMLRPYDRVVVIGPIWAGMLVAPLRKLISLCVKEEKPVYFAVSCESGDELKDQPFGYNRVLREAERIGKGWVRQAVAFPNALVRDPNTEVNPKVPVKTLLSQANYGGELQARVEAFATNVVIS
jgi:flavodoxin